MKQSEILKVFAKEFGTDQIEELNKILKAKVNDKIKFKLMGESLGYLGLTVVVKSITSDGLKIFDVTRVRLIRFTDIETFVKAKPKVARPVYDQPKPSIAKIAKAIRAKKRPYGADKEDDEDDDDKDEDFGDDFKKSRPKPRRTFIPIPKK
jgi:hypothetical protein